MARHTQESAGSLMLYSLENQRLQDRPEEFSAPDRSDAELLAAIGDRDEAALKSLISRHKSLLHTIIVRIVYNPCDADDVLQQCTLEVWNRAPAYDPEKGAAIAWLVTMVRRRAIDCLRRRNCRDSLVNRYSQEPRPKHDEGVAEESATNHDLGQLLNKLLGRLPAAQASALRLTFYNGLSQRQVAKTTGLALGTIKTRLELGLLKLRAAVGLYGGKREFGLA
jgi:RNA polymerase sigma-70 factor (ECF subfamily)